MLIVSTPNALGLSRLKDNLTDAKFDEGNISALHLSVYDYSQMRLLLAFCGFSPLFMEGFNFYLPFFGRTQAGKRFLGKLGGAFPTFCEDMIVVAHATRPVDMVALHKRFLGRTRA